MKTILLLITILTLNVYGQGQVKPDYFKYAPVVLDEEGKKLHKISVQYAS